MPPATSISAPALVADVSIDRRSHRPATHDGARSHCRRAASRPDADCRAILRFEARTIAAIEFLSRTRCLRSTVHVRSEVIAACVTVVVVRGYSSLDGVAETPDGFFAYWDDPMDANLGAVMRHRTRSASADAATRSGPQFCPAAISQPSDVSSTGWRSSSPRSTRARLERMTNASCGRR